MAGGCLEVSLGFSRAVVVMQIRPWDIGTDHSQHTHLSWCLLPGLRSLLQPSCRTLCLGTLNKQGQKPLYLSLFLISSQYIPCLVRRAAAHSLVC